MTGFLSQRTFKDMNMIAYRQLRSSVFPALAALLLSLPVWAGSAQRAAPEWKRIADGVDYATFSFSPSPEDPSTAIHAFRVDPRKLKLDVVTAKDEQSGSTAAELARRSGASLVINGGFFTPDHRSIGLIVKDGRELSPLHRTSWWSVFSISGETPAIHSLKDFPGPSSVRMALQVGPRLAVEGRIPKLKENVAARSAVGITRGGEVVIAITQGPGISMTELARRMSMSGSEGGLSCPDAMALDGGSSSQIHAKFGKFELSLANIARVTNGLAVFTRK